MINLFYKTKISLLTIFFVANAHSQTIGTETANNQILLENAKISEENLKKTKGKTEPAPSMFGNSSKSNPNGVDSLSNLTDQEKQLSENFVHQGLANRVLQKSCSDDMQKVCAGEEGDHKFLGMDPSMVKIAAKMYAALSAAGGDVLPISAKEEPAKAETKTENNTSATGNAPTQNSNTNQANNAQQNSPTNKKEKPTDYCKYIPAATEGIAAITEQAAVKNMNNMKVNADTAQKDALLKAAKSHDERAKMAQIQALGFWGGSACYAYNATVGGWQMDTSLAIKLGATAFLGAFYQSEVSANKGYAKKVREVANQLPGKGDCNPITDQICYCSQPETENDPTYCLPTLHKNKIAFNNGRVACVNDQMQQDPNCNCDRTNTCFDKFIDGQAGSDMQFGLGYANSPFRPVASLAHGQLEGGTLNSSGIGGLSAIAKRALNDAASKINPNLNLNAEQRKLAEAAISKGIPPKIAALMASFNPPQGAMNNALSKLNGSSGGYYSNYNPTKNAGSDFSGGYGLGTSGRKNDKSNANDFLSKFNQKAKNTNSNVIEFANKAQESAPQISKEKDKFLFDIISNRYQVSGRRMLQLEK